MAKRQTINDDAEQAPTSSGLPLHLKYRPHDLRDVWGQPEVIKSLSSVFKGGAKPHAYLFTGPKGCGKTTLARIVSESIGATAENIIEVDAASNSGIEQMRELTSTLLYKGFGDSPRKAVIIDEAHGLSKNAWDSLLKILEEPPEHVYFCLCTTNESKVPSTVASRCLVYKVKPLRRDDMLDFLEGICKLEAFDVDPDILSQVERAAEGSMRQALTMLEMVRGCRTPQEAATLLSQPFETPEMIELCRAMVDGKLTWSRAREILLGSKEDDPEGVRLMIVNYLQSVILNTKDDDRAARLIETLCEFSRPITNKSEKLAPILVALANVIRWK